MDGASRILGGGLVGAPDLRPAAEAKAAQPASILPESKTTELMARGDLGAMIAAMLLEAGADSREAAREAKDAALAAEEAACARKIEHMKGSASARLWGGIAAGLGTTLSGATTIGGSFASSQSVQQRWAAGGKIGEGVARAGASGFEFQADASDRDAARAEREMTQAKRAVESASEDENDANELLRRTLDHYKEFVSAKDQAQQALLFRV